MGILLKRTSIFLLLALSVPIFAWADERFFGIDHRINRDDTGMWSRSNQVALQTGSIVVVLGGALWEGTDSRLGKTFWQATDAMAATAVLSNTAKIFFRRERPVEGNDSDEWFASKENRSFPSAEVAHITSVITPFIIEYQKDSPEVWGLTVLPIYCGIARMKSQAHWQSDVLAGAALGAGVGYYFAKYKSPFFVELVPHGVTVGIRKRF
jgi:membrane-associated phospholipid phosphatase